MRYPRGRPLDHLVQLCLVAKILAPIAYIAAQLLAPVDRYEGHEPHREELAALDRRHTVVVAMRAVE